jgi:hypothetical protein
MLLVACDWPFDTGEWESLVGTSMKKIDPEPFNALVGKDIFELIIDRAPTKVRTRVAKSLEHYTKAARLVGVDDEMGAIRLIAAEEELVVAIFEWLKLNAEHMPQHKDFIGMYKNHVVKLAFHPVLTQLGWILAELLEHGITFKGLEDVLHWSVAVVRHEDRVVMRISDGEGKGLLDANPLDVAITLEGENEALVIESLYEQFSSEIAHQTRLSVRQFVTTRADFRNKLLYSEDGGSVSMAEPLQELIDKVFSRTARDLLWALALLLTNKPTAKSWGLISQFIGLYRKVLTEAKVLKESVT